MTITPRQIAAAFRLADSMRRGPFDPDGFHRQADELAAKLNAQTGEELFSRIERDDQSRGKLYRESKWVAGAVDLADCSVWAGMGGRKWAVGPVPLVSSMFTEQADRVDRVWKMAEVIGHVIERLPIIIVRTKSDPSRFRIDDGSHRAVAAYLAGHRVIGVLIGTAPAHLNYDSHVR